MTASTHNPFETLRALRESMEPDADASAEDVVSTENQASASGASALMNVTLTLFYERKGRSGKDATIIVAPDHYDRKALLELASQLKRTLGTGGSVRGTEILLQGDRREKLRKFLSDKGFKVKG